MNRVFLTSSFLISLSCVSQIEGDLNINHSHSDDMRNSTTTPIRENSPLSSDDKQSSSSMDMSFVSADHGDLYSNGYDSQVISCQSDADCGAVEWLEEPTCNEGDLKARQRVARCEANICLYRESVGLYENCSCGCDQDECIDHIQGWGESVSIWVCVTAQQSCYRYQSCEFRCPDEQGEPCDEPEQRVVDQQSPCSAMQCP
jgi:hypothetical protein